MEYGSRVCKRGSGRSNCRSRTMELGSGRYQVRSIWMHGFKCMETAVPDRWMHGSSAWNCSPDRWMHGSGAWNCSSDRWMGQNAWQIRWTGQVHGTAVQDDRSMGHTGASAVRRLNRGSHARKCASPSGAGLRRLPPAPRPAPPIAVQGCAAAARRVHGSGVMGRKNRASACDRRRPCQSSPGARRNAARRRAVPGHPVLSPRSPSPMISDRSEVTKMIRAAKVRKGIRWAEVAAKVGLSKGMDDAACLGQMTLDKTRPASSARSSNCPTRRSRGCRSCRTRARCRARCRPIR